MQVGTKQTKQIVLQGIGAGGITRLQTLFASALKVEPVVCLRGGERGKMRLHCDMTCHQSNSPCKVSSLIHRV